MVHNTHTQCHDGKPNVCFKINKQDEIMSLLASECDEWAELYPCLSLLAGIGLVIPVSSVNCERDFSALNRVKASL